MGDILKINDLSKSFGGVLACSKLTFDVRAGEILGLIGPNGAGKTTVFNLITGVFAPTQGSIVFNGETINKVRADKIVKKGIARTFQNIRLFQNLSVLENVVISLDMHNADYKFFDAILKLPVMRAKERHLYDKAMDYLKIVGLEGEASKRAKGLPYGLQRKLEIARALALEPKLLLLDEPAAGMNPEESMELSKLISKFKSQFDLSIMLIEHHMDVVMELCDRIVVINFGEKISEGTPDEIQEDPVVLKAYLGEGYKHA